NHPRDGGLCASGGGSSVGRAHDRKWWCRQFDSGPRHRTRRRVIVCSNLARVAAKGEEVSLTDADAYDRFMGRFSRPLAVPFADFVGLPLDGLILDVGCGPGALTAELARRAGPERVTAGDPSEEFVAAPRFRHPGVQVIRAPAEDLPFEGGCFAATLAQLVVNVMDDPVAGLREMARVTRDGGVVAACVWDFTDGGPIGPFWDAARALDPDVE